MTVAFAPPGGMNAAAPNFRTSGPASTGGKMQMSQSKGAFFPGRSSNLGGLGLRPATTGNSVAGGRRTKSAAELRAVECAAEVRGLGGDEPREGDMDSLPRSSHDQLMMRLKSRAARAEAENTRAFLASYRLKGPTIPATEAHLDAILKATANRAEELRIRSDDTQLEAAEAERKLERANCLNVGRSTDSELQNLTAFERSQRRIHEDKRDEELQRQRDEAQANYAKVHRRLQNELIELRDYKVLLREFRRVRLEKLQELFGRVQDGRKLRASVREMIRHGAQRILQRLEAANLPLEPWMREVLVNSCHLEIRIEDGEAKLLQLRRQALQPLKPNIEVMLSQSKQERFEKVCARTWDGQQRLRESHARRQSEPDGDTWAGSGDVFTAPGDGATMANTGNRAHGRAVAFAPTDDGQVAASGGRGIPDNLASEMASAEADIAALRRLLADMRQNAAAVTCNNIRQAEKACGPQAGKDATEWGRAMLTLLVSEDFAKVTMKELHKSAPHAKLTQ